MDEIWVTCMRITYKSVEKGLEQRGTQNSEEREELHERVLYLFTSSNQKLEG